VDSRGLQVSPVSGGDSVCCWLLPAFGAQRSDCLGASLLGFSHPALFEPLAQQRALDRPAVEHRTFLSTAAALEWSHSDWASVPAIEADC